jgi:hypothetical protein
MEIKNKSLAELQALRNQLATQDIIAAKAAVNSAGGKDKLDNLTTLLEAVEGRIELLSLKAKDADKLAADADAALDAGVAIGEIPPQGTRRAELKAMFTDPNTGRTAMDQVAGKWVEKHNALKATAAAATGAAPLNAANANAALGGRVAPVAGAVMAGASASKFALDAESAWEQKIESGWDFKEAVGGYAELQALNSRATVWGMTKDQPGIHDLQYKKARLALVAGHWYKNHLKGKEERFDTIPMYEMCKALLAKRPSNPLNAADYNDPYSELATLSGTLVLQRTLPVFAYAFPEFGAMTTDFSDAPGLFQQAERTRIVTQANVIAYTPTLQQSNTYVAGAPAGVPQGWISAVEGTDTDVTLTLSDYIGVQIAIGQNILASTTRRLFDEQAVLAIKAIAQYLAQMVTNLFVSTGTAPNSAGSFNYYSTVNGTLVPNAYPVFPVNSQTFSMSFIDRLDAAFTSAKVPEDGRFLMLNPTFYAALRGDTRLEFLYAASAKNLDDASAGQFLTEARLPKLSGFAPYKAGYLPTQTPQGTVVTGALPVLTSNVAGFAGQKAGIIIKSRLPIDFTTALPSNVQAPGSITTITDPDTKISISLVQFINLVNGYAAWRPEVMLGTTIGDNRAGLVLQGT